MELNQCMANAQAASEKMSGKNEELTKKCDDPIGFIDGNGDRFDFITDRNDDGIFNGVNEFLGAQNGFDEMRGLDKDGNGIVEGNELAGLKLLKTDKSGKQSFIDASAMDIKVDLKSYQDKGGASIGKGQSLLGNFNLTVGGESIQGYNTLDSSEYLNKTYGNMFNQSLTGGSASKPANISNPFSSASSVDLNFKGIDSGAIAQSASQLLASAESTVQFGSKMAGLTLSAANAIDEKAPETKPETDKKDNGKKADKTSKVETPAVEIKTAEAPKVDILKADNSTKKPLLEEQIAA